MSKVLLLDASGYTSGTTTVTVVHYEPQPHMLVGQP
jgi:hypothetical protein